MSLSCASHTPAFDIDNQVNLFCGDMHKHNPTHLIRQSKNRHQTHNHRSSAQKAPNYKAISKRADAVLLACLRSGHTPLLKTYANLIDQTGRQAVDLW